MALLTKRSSILGLPIGRSQIAWGRVALMGGGAAALAAAGQQGRKQAERLKAPLEKGKEALGTASDVGEQVSDVTESMSQGGGGVLGKATSMFTGGGGGGGGGEGGDGDYTKKLRLVIKEHQDVAVPRQVAYNQWTQYPDFPQFMKGVQSVEPEDEAHQKWTVKVGPSRRTWKAEVSEQVPDERIEWEGSEGAEHFGVVTFHELDDNLTRVQVEMEYHPNGFVEKVGNIFLAARMRVRKDLRLFKHYMELENEETGSWRGEIAEGEVAEAAEGEEQEPEAAEAEAEGEGEAREEEAGPAEEQEEATDEDRGAGPEEPSGNGGRARAAQAQRRGQVP